MVDQVPEGAIPEEEFNQANTQASSPSPQASQQPQAVPPGAIPAEEFQSDEEKYGSTGEQIKTALEQAASGLTLGGSKVLETKVLGVSPEAIAGREAANPVTATLSNIGGTTGLLALTGGLGGLAEGAGAAARIGAAALEGAGIGGINQVTDDWSQDKALDAQKIAASAGLGALLGGAGASLVEGVSALRGKYALAKVSSDIEKNAGKAAEDAIEAASPPVDAPQTGVQPTSYEEIANRVKNARANETAIPLPAQAELDDAISRVALENPVNPLQRDSLGSQRARDIYQSYKEGVDKIGADFQNYEALQKAELVKKTGEAIQAISPGIEPTGDAYQGGKQAIEAFTKQYQGEKKALAPIFENLKTLKVNEDLLPGAVTKMTEAVPGISQMFDASGNELAIRPYKTAWGVDKATYQAVKEAVESLTGEPNDLQTLWNVRKGLDQHVDVLTQGQAPREIRALKAALMDQMQEATGNPEIRDAFKRYAINEQQRQVIENAFGASVGTPEFGQISKVKPEMIGDKIFGNSATVEAAKNILPPEEFNSILANWISEAKANATDKGAFSSNKFNSFLKRNQDALNIAFRENPAQLQNLKDLTTISRILPDAPSINPSGTGKTVFNMLENAKGHNVTWEGILLKAGQKIGSEISKKLKMNKLNEYLSGQALKNAQEQALKAHVEKMNDRIEKGVKMIFSGTASQSRKSQ